MIHSGETGNPADACLPNFGHAARRILRCDQRSKINPITEIDLHFPYSGCARSNGTLQAFGDPLSDYARLAVRLDLDDPAAVLPALDLRHRNASQRLDLYWRIHRLADAAFATRPQVPARARVAAPDRAVGLAVEQSYTRRSPNMENPAVLVPDVLPPAVAPGSSVAITATSSPVTSDELAQLVT